MSKNVAITHWKVMKSNVSKSSNNDDSPITDKILTLVKEKGK